MRPHTSWVGPAILAGLGLFGCASETATAPAAAPPRAAASAAPAPPSPPAPPANTAPPPMAAAQPPPVSSSGAEMAEAQADRDDHHGGLLSLMAMSVRDVELTPAQKSEVEQIRADFVPKLAPARAAGLELAHVLADGVAAGAVNRAKVDAAIDKLATEVQALHDASLDAINRLHATLGPQERAAFVAALEAHWDRWKEAHGQEEQGEHAHHSGYLLALVRDLDLSRDEAEKIRDSFRAKMKDSPQDQTHKDVESHLQAFEAAFKSDAFDAKRLAKGKDAEAHLARWGATRRARFLEAAAPVLTPEQRAKLAEMIRERAEKHGM